VRLSLGHLISNTSLSGKKLATRGLCPPLRSHITNKYNQAVIELNPSREHIDSDCRRGTRPCTKRLRPLGYHRDVYPELAVDYGDLRTNIKQKNGPGNTHDLPCIVCPVCLGRFVSRAAGVLLGPVGLACFPFAGRVLALWHARTPIFCLLKNRSSDVIPNRWPKPHPLREESDSICKTKKVLVTTDGRPPLACPPRQNKI